MTQEHPEEPGRVPVGELRALAEKWQSVGIKIHPQNPDPTSRAGEKASEELEAVFERYE